MSGDAEKSLRYAMTLFSLTSIKTSVNSKDVMLFQNIMALKEKETRRYLKHMIPLSKTFGLQHTHQMNILTVKN